MEDNGLASRLGSLLAVGVGGDGSSVVVFSNNICIDAGEIEEADGQTSLIATTGPVRVLKLAVSLRYTF